MIHINQNIPQHFGKTLLVRGFAEFIPWKHIKNSSEFSSGSIIKDICNFIINNNYNTIVWDGDLYKSDSFTHIIYELMNMTNNSSINFVSYKAALSETKFMFGDMKNGEMGWNNISNDIYLTTIDTDKNLKWFEKYTQITEYIYNDIFSKSNEVHIMYFGGGKLITSEMSSLTKYINEESYENTRIFVFDIPRSSFIINDNICETKLQFLGNSEISTNPLTYFPSSTMQVNKIYPEFHFKFSCFTNLFEYKLIK